jgi:release factor glutamine methyltransferase
VRCEPALRAAAERLGAAGIESPQWDAQQLLAHVVGTSRGTLPLTRELTSTELNAFDELVARRVARTPLQHLTGTVGFRYIDIDVGNGVFVPRPETEVVAGLAIDYAMKAGAHPIVVDLCSGSGVIPLAVANEVPSATVYAVEREPGAITWLRRNAEVRRSAGDTPIVVVEADAAVAAERLADIADIAGTVDVVVSNPPYVAEDELDGVDPEVRDHDPQVALVAGGDGLDVIRLVVAAAEGLLRPDGRLVVEHSDRQGESCPALVSGRRGWTDVEDHRDLAGRPRVTTARWVGAS